ncbi:uncharacterized protein NPIL_502451 [Nephila pilipes]|uniref:Uncharacterized protein n=1 Tax=Nephila pilipes TaxID=299642 RepID=A0A8X6TR64_NEPPI|nr:uncharacterized protein NPIL_502451 [Nephila pilipes]
MSKADKEWFKYVLRKQQSNMQLDLRMHVCVYGSHVLQHEMYNRLQMAERCQHGKADQPYNRLAFWYNPDENYSLTRHVLIGTMTVVCLYCKALKFSGETKGMCCAAGKIKLPQLREPPEPLKTLLVGYTAESKHFLSNIKKYNSCFQMTSFGAEVITTHSMPTFKVKGQIYHKVGSCH